MESMPIAQLAEILSASWQGPVDLSVTGVSTLKSAGPNQIACFKDSRYKADLLSTTAGVVIVQEKHAALCPVPALIVANPEATFLACLRLFNPPTPTGQGAVHPSAVVGDRVQCHDSAIIGPHVVIGADVRLGQRVRLDAGVVLGDGVVLADDVHCYPGVVLYDGVQVGARSVIHAGAVIGADGFGYHHQEDGSWDKIPQIGSVHIGADVEIGALTAIDCGAIEDTVIEDGVKIDDHVMIGHNVKVGAHTVISGWSGVAGSTTIGSYCMIGGGVGILDHLTIASHVVLTGTSFLAKNLLEKGVYSSGLTALPARAWKRILVRLSQLESIVQRIKKLEGKS